MQLNKQDAIKIAKKISTCFRVYATGAFSNVDLTESQIAEIIDIAANHPHSQEAIEKYCDKIIGCM